MDYWSSRGGFVSRGCSRNWWYISLVGYNKMNGNVAVVVISKQEDIFNFFVPTGRVHSRK